MSTVTDTPPPRPAPMSVRRALMCRRCGEPDRRGSAKNRRRRRERLLTGENGVAGNGQLTVCIWCQCLLGAVAGYIAGVEIFRLEQDRLTAGGAYAFWNLVPSCPGCNRARTVHAEDVPAGYDIDTAAA